MKVLIFEDEIPAYEKLLDYIHRYLSSCTVLGWGRSVMEAKHFLEKHPDVDLIFSDIQLLDGTSFLIFEEIQVTCPIIFCTAFDQYVLQAFQTNGIAYLMKPYDEHKFKEAIDKYKLLFDSNGGIKTETITELKQMMSAKNYKQRFSIKRKDGIKLMNVDDIVGFQANGDFSFAFDKKGAKHVVNFSLGDIESKVDPARFYRINRSEVISIDFIEKIEPYFKNRLSIKLVGREEVIHTSTAKTPDFREWIER